MTEKEIKEKRKSYYKEKMLLYSTPVPLENFRAKLFRLLQCDVKMAIMDAALNDYKGLHPVKGFSVTRRQFHTEVVNPFTNSLFIKDGNYSDEVLLYTVAETFFNTVDIITLFNFYMSSYYPKFMVTLKEGPLRLDVFYKLKKIQSTLWLPDPFEGIETDIDMVKKQEQLKTSLKRETEYTVLQDICFGDMSIPPENIHCAQSGQKVTFELNNEDIIFYYWKDLYETKVMAVNASGNLASLEIQKLLHSIYRALS